MKEFYVDPSCWSFILKTYFSSMVSMGMSTNDYFLSICTDSLSLDGCWRHFAVFAYFLVGIFGPVHFTNAQIIKMYPEDYMF